MWINKFDYDRSLDLRESIGYMNGHGRGIESRKRIDSEVQETRARSYSMSSRKTCNVKQIIFAVFGQSVSFEELTGLKCHTQDDKGMQEIAERVLMNSPMVSGYHIKEDE